MIKSSRPTPDSQNHPGPPPATQATAKESRRVPLWQALALPIAAILIFFLLLEGGLALFGVKPALQTEDPFVGFASNVPLFVSSSGPTGRQILTTAPNKLGFFNPQSFQREKSPGTFRIFCLGASTTYGHPYTDPTSFAGWLREFLPAADEGKRWEVINAGGISYASYRVAHLMEELVKYQPDLFIVYTGHNEFLEERTYGQIKKIPPVIRSTVSILARTRTWSAMTAALRNLGIHPQVETGNRDQLRGEVNAILERSAGLDRYSRDDTLRDNILKHYRVSLERMAALASSIDAKIIFVTPASNLKDCLPFKSEHTAGLDAAAQQRSEQMLAEAKEGIVKKDWDGALRILDAALAFDPRHAELLYRRGRVLFAQGRFDEAERALRLALDEDVCPLRALTPLPGIVAEVARNTESGLVDYIELLRQRMLKEHGHPILGEEYFLDHVHPTIEGYKILALELIKAMAEQGMVQYGAGWGERTIAAVEKKVEGGIDQKTHGKALITLARTLLWAGKFDDAERLAEQALAKAGDDQEIARNIDTTLVKIYQKRGDTKRAMQLLYSTIEKYPDIAESRYILGLARLEDGPFMQLEEAAANLLLVCRWMPYDDQAFQYFGIAMAMRDRLGITYASLREALRLNPKNEAVKNALARLPQLTGNQSLNPQAPTIVLDVYPSNAPRKLMQVRRDPKGNNVPDGIVVEFYENGRLKHFLDMEQGVADGFEVTWDPEGRQLARVEYRQGKAVDSPRSAP